MKLLKRAVRGLISNTRKLLKILANLGFRTYTPGKPIWVVQMIVIYFQ